MRKPPAAPEKRAYDSKATRRRILDVAAAEFQTRGYHATSMHDVMRIANAAGGSLYHHFPTKKSLGLAVIQERVTAAIDETWIEPVRSATTALQGVRSVFRGVARSIERGGRAPVGCPLNNLALELSLVDADFQHALSAVFESWRVAIAEKLRADRRAGVATGADPDERATMIVASFSGAMALAKASKSVEPIRACARELARLP